MRVTWVRQYAWWSRGDRPELLFGDAAVECGLDGGPGVPDGCWRVVRVVVKVFDEFLGVVARASSGLKDEWGQVLFYSRLALKPMRPQAADMRPAFEEKGVTMAVSM